MSGAPDKIVGMTGAPLELNQPALKAALMHPRGSFGRVEIVGSTGSTNTDLAASAVAPEQIWPDLSVLIADAQEAGKGRLGRTWVVPAGAAMISSVLLRPGDRVHAAAGRPDQALKQLLLAHPAPMPDLLPAQLLLAHQHSPPRATPGFPSLPAWHCAMRCARSPPSPSP